MKSELPTKQDIEILVGFLSRLYAPGFEPVKLRQGGAQNKEGVIMEPWIEYVDIVDIFFKTAAQDCWSDNEYTPGDAGEMLEDERFIKNASLSQVRTMLTYCVRGERFFNGHWEVMIKQGKVRSLLERLKVILESDT
jgi:hypothetical protein